MESPARRHLQLWIGALDRVLRSAVDRQGQQLRRLEGASVSPVAISASHAAILLEEAGKHGRHGFGELASIALDDGELAMARELATNADRPLPLDSLRSEGLGETEVAAVVIAAAAEISVAYGRLYAYLVDDLTRAAPSVEVVLRLTTGSAEPDSLRRAHLSAAGRLRRSGLLIAPEDAASDLRTTLRLGPGVLAWLTGMQDALPVPLVDPNLIDPRAGATAELIPEHAARLVQCLSSNGVVGVWGSAGDGAEDAAFGLADAAGLAVYRLPVREQQASAALASGLVQAAHDGAALWISVDDLHHAVSSDALSGWASVLAGVRVPVLLTGRIPWRPLPLLEQGRYAEARAVDVIAPHRRRWLAARPPDQAAMERATALHQFDFMDRRAALALAGAEIEGHGDGDALAGALERACRLVANPAAHRLATVIEPERGPADLVLPAPLHARVLEIASFYARAGEVDARWGFGHMSASAGGLRVLLTGAAGTGKTLAAEVIAGELGRSLLKVDLSQLVSKWVGDTEKNLEAVFTHAENSHAVLFFDEADTLFGKRGEIRHGTDRYANLEVGFLLQRLETFDGLAVCASNLREEIDPAFTRRFDITLHFPSPEEPERRRMWRLAFARGAPLEPSVDPDELAELDLTGAAIMSAARMAGMLAASEGSGAIGRAHVAEAVARQYQQQARLLGTRAMSVLGNGSRQ